VSCEHSQLTVRPKDDSWYCRDCGEKIRTTSELPCINCQDFIDTGSSIGICGANFEPVTKTLHKMYDVAEGNCHTGDNA